MQPMLDTFNKAGTFGYAYALLPLLTCRRSRVGPKKNGAAPFSDSPIARNHFSGHRPFLKTGWLFQVMCVDAL